MRDYISKWWNRKWSNWELNERVNVFNKKETQRPSASYEIYRRESNDGRVEYRTVKKFKV